MEPCGTLDIKLQPIRIGAKWYYWLNWVRETVVTGRIDQSETAWLSGKSGTGDFVKSFGKL